MKSISTRLLIVLIVFAANLLQAQHSIRLNATIDQKKNIILIDQELTYFNQSNDTLQTVLLNDWINAYSDRHSYLGKRFSDEFVRSFHFATKKELGATTDLIIEDGQRNAVVWSRPSGQIDLIEIDLKDKILPSEKRTFHLKYKVKIPHDRFTKYGYDSSTENLSLKDWYLAPARYENQKFTRYSNADTDDIANGLSDYELVISIPKDFTCITDLNQVKQDEDANGKTYTLSGKSRTDFSLYVESKPAYYSYKNDEIEVVTNLKDNNLQDIQKALMIERVIDFTRNNVGQYPFEKITVSQVDYDRNPFYGLNQLPSFINVFQDEFLFELKFLKTYLNDYLKNSLQLDARRDNWIYDGIQLYLMMKYVEIYRPEMKMLGGLSRLKVFKAYKLTNLEFNDQYNYFYLFMARKNLDQPLASSKDALIRFNEKIASKYRAGLSFYYLDQYLGNDIVPNTIKNFYNKGKSTMTGVNDFEKLVKEQTAVDVDWFFQSVIKTRDLIDYTFKDVSKSKDSITFTIKNRGDATVPIPVYGLKDGNVIFKEWYDNIAKDSTFTVDRRGADKIVLNYRNEVPEFNRRNNWNSLKSFFGNNRPFKFILFKDIEDPDVNQITYVPSITYNFYDGVSPGIRLSNKTLLNKPFAYDINPVYSSKTGNLRGLTSLSFTQLNRDSNLFSIKYGISSSYFNYAPDATFFRINPYISFNFRDTDIRKNDKQGILFRYNAVQKQESRIVMDNTLENYSIFNLRYGISKQELVHFFNFQTDLQVSNSFGRVSAELNFRQLFRNNRQFNFRLFAGSLLYDKSSTDTFFFGVSQINDYLFEQELLGRSEKSGIFSQQFIMGDGGFKSKVIPESVNKWLVTTNLSFNVWNWIEVYGDLGIVKNSNSAEKIIYGNGVRFNLVPDYFELYFPVYSNNGWEIADDNYKEKIRFVFTIDPKLLLNLFTRKWF